MKQHSPQFLGLVNQAKERIHEITATELKTMIDDHAHLYLIDVREDHEWSTGHIPTAIHIGKGIIERDIEKTIPDFQAPIVVYCSGGFRCALVADMDKDKPDAVNWAQQGESINFVHEMFEEKPMEKMDNLRKQYDFIILDTPPNYMPAAFKAIMLSDFIILPCSPSFLDQSNLADAISIPRMAQKPFKILATRVNRRQKLSEKLIEELVKTGQAFETCITAKTAVLESPFQGKWIGSYMPGCPSHKEFLALADEMIKIANVWVPPYPKTNQKLSANL